MHNFRNKIVNVKRKTMKIKFCHKEYITGEEVKIIEIIFLFCLPAGRVCTGKPITMLKLVNRLGMNEDNFYSKFDGFWQSYISIEVCRDCILALASSCKKQLTGFFVCLLFFLKVKHIS